MINVVDEADPKPFRRRSRGTFVVGLYERESHSLPEDYPMLVRALANIVLCYVPGEGAWFTTMERGHYGDSAEQGEEALADAVVERLLPLARSRLVIDNEFLTDLEPELWERRRGDRGDHRARARGSATSTSCPRRSRSRTCSTSASCATSSGSTGSAASPTATSRSARTSAASG